MEIGDKFKIDYKKIKSIYPIFLVCRFPDKEYIITGFSKSGISAYYLSEQNNIKCRCSTCENNCISINQIIITKTKKELDRDLKIDQLLYS